MITTPAIPAFSPARLWDYAAMELQSELEANLAWLDKAFGKAIRQQRPSPEGRPYTFPAAYSGTGDYLSMFPDGHLGNFAWLDVADEQRLEGERDNWARITADVGLVFWLDLRTAYPANPSLRSIENAKHDALEALKAVRLTRSVLLIESVSERKENIYRGYDYREIPDTFIFWPYACFRMQGQMQITQPC
jgi:hypothetical protein